MVGMSGKSGETRRTGAGVVTPNKKLDHQPQQQNAKPKPSAEQVNIARILGDTDTTPADMVDRIAKVMAVVSSKSEEEVTIALHDNDYCVEKAIETLLDSAGDVTDVWSQPVSRKSKKKSVAESEFIQAPGDTSKPAASHTSGSSNTRGTSRAAAQHTRENYGGSVLVVEHPRGGAGRGRGRSQSSGRNRRERGESKSDRREGDFKSERREGGGDYKSDRREGGGDFGRSERREDFRSDRGGPGRESGGGNRRNRDRERTDRPRTNGGSRSRRKDTKPLHNKEGVANTVVSSSSHHRRTRENWDSDPVPSGESVEPQQQQQPEEQQQQPQQQQLQLEQEQEHEQEQQLASTAVWFPPPQECWQGEGSLHPQEQWSADPVPPPSQTCSVFPEALLTSTVDTPPATPPVTREEEESASKIFSTRFGGGRSRTRKYLPSQIPSKPVEMPSGVDTATLQLSSMGIDFMTTEVPSPTTTFAVTTPPVPSSTVTTSPSAHQYESSLPSPQPLIAKPPTGGALLPTPYPPPSFPSEPPSVLPIPAPLESTSTGYPAPPPPSVTGHAEAPPTTLEPPPGLTHPSKQQTSDKSSTGGSSHLQQGLLPEPLALPTHSTQATPTEMLSSHMPQVQPKPAISQLPTPSAAAFTSLASITLQPETTPTGKMPQVSTVSFTAPSPVTVSTPSSVPHTTAEALFTTKPPPTSVPPAAGRQHHTGGPTNTAGQSTSGLMSASSTNNPQRSAGKQHGLAAGGVQQHPQPMLYPTATPNMMQYYHHPAAPVVMPPYAAGPAAYTTDMESMNRYSFYPQHPTSQEQASSSVGRDHVSSTYTTDAGKQLDMAAAISSSALPQQQQQQQQQQGTLQHPSYFYPHNNMAMYSLYAMQAQAAQQAAQFQLGHKPGVTTTFATSYQPNPQQFTGLTGYDDGSAPDYKPFPGGASLGKSTNAPSTSTATDFQGFKYDKQASFGYHLPHQSTAYIGAPAGFMPLPALPAHIHAPLMATHHDNPSRQKHGKNQYTGQSSNLFN